MLGAILIPTYLLFFATNFLQGKKVEPWGYIIMRNAIKY